MKFMVCYDGSDASRAALKLAEEYAAGFSAAIHVVASTPAAGEVPAADWGAVQADLDRERDKCVVEVLADDLTDGESLVGYAEREAVDAIFVGVRKVSKVGKLLFGSTAQYVILSAPCPVISVRGE